jgi:DoxX-like protein
MAAETRDGVVSKKQLWTGRIISGIVCLFLLADSAGKLMQAAPVMQGMMQSGFKARAIVPIGIILLVSVILYAIPQTSVLGAILLTGYLGGAVVTNFRLSLPLLSYTLVPVYAGILVWGALYLRDSRLRALVPLRRNVS